MYKAITNHNSFSIKHHNCLQAHAIKKSVLIGDTYDLYYYIPTSFITE